MAHCHVPDIPLSERLGYDTGETAALIGVSVSHVYVLIKRGDLQTVKVAGRRIIPRWAIEALLGCPIGVLLTNNSPPANGLSGALATEASPAPGSGTAPLRCQDPQRKVRSKGEVRGSLRASAAIAPPSPRLDRRGVSEEGHGIFAKIYKDYPVDYFWGLVTLAKVMKVEIGGPHEFDRPPTKEEALDRLERTAGPAARKMLEQFLEQVRKVEAKYLEEESTD